VRPQDVEAVIHQRRRRAGGIIPADAREIEQAIGQFEQSGIPASGVEIKDGADSA
jgi:hypothetical protein